MANQNEPEASVLNTQWISEIAPSIAAVKHVWRDSPLNHRASDWIILATTALPSSKRGLPRTSWFRRA
jgi:hypothetical protein